ncbi:hypothetical protein N7451_000005 [Penicillium sp. IBT 35674x]|nr:hypothetical protein N7451_000005 [Penicillium sp. IBT 35674x]
MRVAAEFSNIEAAAVSAASNDVGELVTLMDDESMMDCTEVKEIGSNGHQKWEARRQRGQFEHHDPAAGHGNIDTANVLEF